MIQGAPVAKPQNRAYSRYSIAALSLLGQLIRTARIEQKITGGEMASRMGVSRSLIQRIEKGDPGCTIGAVFEAAAIVGVPLFEADKERLGAHRANTGEILRLLPKMARRSKRVVKDDF
jgi:transcriptional regulator with XRE-family HTH domain